METIEAILARRSIRKYQPKQVPQEFVRKIMECAMAAPSASNQQPWHFVVVDDRAQLDAIAAEHPYAQMIKEATLAVVVCADTHCKNPGYWPQDCAASTQNILLAACALGLGTCWCGVHPNEGRVAAFKKLFGLPENVVPFGVIAVGYPNEEKPPANRYNEERIHKNRW